MNHISLRGSAIAVGLMLFAGPSLDRADDVRATGPDMQHCQLMNLNQFGRLDDTVGLALMMTSWNVGDAALTWQAVPAAEHPFTVMNLYRLEGDRLEQIGQSWARHGFCALGSAQCGGSCAPAGCNTLEPNCTNTNSGGTSASQDLYGPRSEIDPWTGAWSYAGSHNSQGSHNHDPVEHRLAVHDADLDPALHAGATYYAESYFASFDDADVWNSAAYKPVTVVGAPGGNWSFGMSGSATPPEIGFALDAWAGADQAVFAPEMPVIEFVSVDGRGVIASKATELGAR